MHEYTIEHYWLFKWWELASFEASEHDALQVMATAPPMMRNTYPNSGALRLMCEGEVVMQGLLEMPPEILEEIS